MYPISNSQQFSKMGIAKYPLKFIKNVYLKGTLSLLDSKNFEDTGKKTSQQFLLPMGENLNLPLGYLIYK